MDRDDRPEASLRGSDVSLTFERGARSFNPSIINAHDEGDPDVTLLDLSPAKAGEGISPMFDDILSVESRGINIFKIVSAQDHSKAEEIESDAASQRSLEEVLTDNPDKRLFNLDDQTLAFAGLAVKQVVLEATYGFFQKCISEPKLEKLWDRIIGPGNVAATAQHSISVPDGIMDLKNGVRSPSTLISNCVGILSQDSAVTNQKTLRQCLSRAVTLCDALGDEHRKQALENATHKLDWLMLGLDCKTMELYRNANRRLDKVNMEHPVVFGAAEGRAEALCDKRRREERNILQLMNREYEGIREPFRVLFIETLQSLLAL
ncbi:hypothetical protein J7T55_010197 [Diaporthe amygdali]|uniref:uncharacterized protein n=1 Tax=Phomopsis amygdali TaxID=1214568 RepID=UPI0022FE468D|nr:uncharacterized protein J7T55_010197 [Diaporthe amygdali]KAJ0113953.1 hypothetical protein J7T55_010197 [Diaporthe amygdali]